MDNHEIRELREALGLTTQELADKLGVARYTINRWESGQTKPLPAFVKILERLKSNETTRKQKTETAKDATEH